MLEDEKSYGERIDRVRQGGCSRDEGRGAVYTGLAIKAMPFNKDLKEEEELVKAVQEGILDGECSRDPHSESISVYLRNIKEASVAGADGDGQGPTS